MGKTTVSFALEILQRIAKGTNRIKDLVKPKDFTRERTDIPMRFEIEVELDAVVYEYVIAFELPEGFKELRVFEERLTAGGRLIYDREKAQVNLAKTSQDDKAKFQIDWHLVALPIVQERSTKDPLFIFKRWLASMLILRPIPILINGNSEQDTLQPNAEVTNFGDWFSGLLASAPSAYTEMATYLKQVMPDLNDIKNPIVGADSRSLVVHFSYEQGKLDLPFKELSDGEKCFMVCALVLAANKAYGPLLCFWDEPDNYLAIDEVEHFVMALRQTFHTGGGQFIATSHNPETIRCFSDENTMVMHRRNHLEPTVIRLLSEIQVNGDLINALIRGDVEP